MTYRPRPVSGFPEHLPEIRMAELHMLDRIRATFESYGFASIETPSVEELEVLLAKGETDKEIYTIERLQADENAGHESRLGLHYDLTVPFASYVAQHFNDLVFPFKRYQMQRVWRGERPQAGRFREFTQCDVDVIGIDNLAPSFDAELAAVAMHALRAIGVDDVTLHINNRRLLNGILEGKGVFDSDRVDVIRRLDGLSKLGDEATISAIKDIVGNSIEAENLAKSLVDLAKFCSSDYKALLDKLRSHGIWESGGLAFQEAEAGAHELHNTISLLKSFDVSAVYDLSIARGFDYYTGTVYEGRFDDAPEFGSVVAGGRYDDLAGAFINKKLPGVGISIGFSRLFAKLLQDGRVSANKRSPSDVLVVLPNTDQVIVMHNTAKALRKRGFKVETYHAPQKIGKQMSYAEKKGIPFVWFPPFDESGQHEVKDMTSGAQAQADVETWKP
jgi:histidyl-tRNA synthetase